MIRVRVRVRVYLYVSLSVSVSLFICVWVCVCVCVSVRKQNANQLVNNLVGGRIDDNLLNNEKYLGTLSFKDGEHFLLIKSRILMWLYFVR